VVNKKEQAVVFAQTLLYYFIDYVAKKYIYFLNYTKIMKKETRGRKPGLDEYKVRLITKTLAKCKKRVWLRDLCRRTGLSWATLWWYTTRMARKGMLKLTYEVDQYGQRVVFVELA